MNADLEAVALFALAVVLTYLGGKAAAAAARTAGVSRAAVGGTASLIAHTLACSWEANG